MNRNVYAVLTAIETLAAALRTKDKVEKLIAYSAITVFCRELEANLSNHLNHAYTREKLSYVLLNAEVLADLTSSPHTFEQQFDSLRGDLIILRQPSRWPSECVLRDIDGNEVLGTNNPA